MALLIPTSTPRVLRHLAGVSGLIVLHLLLMLPSIYGQSVPGFNAPEKPKSTAEVSVQVKAARGEAPLSNLYAHLKVDASKIKHLPALAAREKQKEPSEKILRIGVVRTLDGPLSPLTDGSLYRIAEGNVRVMGIVSEGALYTRVHFTEMSLPAGARVFVYSMKNPDDFYGPYEGHGAAEDGTFWTPPMAGDGVVIEYFTPNGTRATGTPFKVSAISHVFKDVSQTDAAGLCNLEVTAEWANVAKSVGMLDFVTGGFEAECTGTLLNDQASDQIPYLLTANHCISTQTEAQSLRVYWNYNSGDDPPGGTPFTDGSNLLATGTGSDFTFVRLTGSLPGGLFFSGWDPNPVPLSTSVTGIHHPEGSHKRISFGSTNSNCLGGLPGPCANFTHVGWNSGVTEPGSSGSGIWTGPGANAQFVGTLTGGLSSCSNPAGNDEYGSFSATYPSISAFLTPPPRTLTVASSNPASGVNITVTPNDNGGLGSGTTLFTRTYSQNTTVTLTAPATASGNNFQKWQRDGVDLTTNQSASVVMGADHTMTAVYVPAVTFVLTVASSNPSSGVGIAVSPNDNSGLGNGTTQFTRTYNQFTTVNLTAAATVGTSTFWKWQVDGVDYVQSQFATVTMNSDHTATAIYVTVTPTPTPTPVPGAGTQPIAFVKQGTSPNSGADIYLVNLDGTNVVNITDTQGDDLRPAWSPDGWRLAYTCRRQPDGSVNGPQRICVRNSDGTGFVVLSNTLADDFGPTWSRDGSQIAFTTGSGSQTVLSVMNADGTGRFPLLFSGAANPDWSPDGWTFVFDQVNSIWNYNRLTQTSLRLTNPTFDSRPRYSPDGSKIVFQSNRDGNTEIYVMNSNGAAQTRLTTNPAIDSSPTWSPDGTKILFTTTRDDPMKPALYVMNSDGGNPTKVTDGSDGVWRSIPAAPVIITETGTNNAAALDSVTFVRGPFRLFNPNNFSADQRTRIILFTSNLGLTQSNLSDPAILVVDVPGYNLPVENVGVLSGVPGLSGSYIIVRLPDGLPTGALQLRVRLRGVTSDASTLNISP